jgi:hypothetical protein
MAEPWAFETRCRAGQIGRHKRSLTAAGLRRKEIGERKSAKVIRRKSLGQAGHKRIDVVVGIVGQGADRVVESSNQRMTGLPLDAAVCHWLPQAGPAESPDQGWGKSKAHLGQ